MRRLNRYLSACLCSMDNKLLVGFVDFEREHSEADLAVG